MSISPILPFALRRLLLSGYQPVTFQRGTMLISPGMEVQYCWLLREGIIKHFSYSDQGEQVIHHFYQAKEVVALEEKFLSPSKAESTLEIVSPSKFIPISYSLFQEIQRKFPDCAIWLLLSLLAANKRLQLQNRLLLLPAKERYILFSQHFPAPMIAIKDIAAYLHLNANTVSKIRTALLYR